MTNVFIFCLCFDFVNQRSFFQKNCHICRRSIDKTQMTKHLKSEHSGSANAGGVVPNNKRCETCDTTFANVIQALKHAEIPHIFHCWGCHLSFVAQDELARHMAVKHKDGQASVYQCQDCDLVLPERHLYDTHRFHTWTKCLSFKGQYVNLKKIYHRFGLYKKLQ